MEYQHMSSLHTSLHLYPADQPLISAYRNSASQNVLTLWSAWLAFMARMKRLSTKASQGPTRLGVVQMADGCAEEFPGWTYDPSFSFSVFMGLLV